MPDNMLAEAMEYWEWDCSNNREQVSIASRGIAPTSYWVARLFNETAYLDVAPRMWSAQLTPYLEKAFLAADAASKKQWKRYRKLSNKADYIYRLLIMDLAKNRHRHNALQQPGARRWISADDFFASHDIGLPDHPKAIQGHTMTGREAGLDTGYLTLEEAARKYRVTPAHVRDVYLKWPVIDKLRPGFRYHINKWLQDYDLSISQVHGIARWYHDTADEHLTPQMRFSRDLLQMVFKNRDWMDYLEVLPAVVETRHVYDFERVLEETGQWMGSEVTHLRQADGSPLRGEDMRFASGHEPVSTTRETVVDTAYPQKLLDRAYRAAQTHKGANRRQTRGAGGRFVKKSA